MKQWKQLTWWLYAFALLSLAVAPVLAEDAEKTAMNAEGMGGMDAESMAAMQEMWQKLRTPGEHHEFLARLEGDWTFDSTMWMEPSAPPMESKGTSTKKMILGGRYIQEDVNGSAMGQPYQGRALTGFDNATGEFMGTWIDDMATSVLFMRGSRNGDALTMNAEMFEPMSQQNMQLRMVTKIIDDDHHVFEYYVTMPGAPEFKQMVLEYARAK